VTVEAEGNRVEVMSDTQLPGFEIQRDGSTLSVEVGILP
jgi:hypothetical protein